MAKTLTEQFNMNNTILAAEFLIRKMNSPDK